jgi:hypothetical protein
LVERFNRTLCQSLAKYVDLIQHDWDKYIPAVLFAYRTMKQDSTRFEPFMLTYGRTAITPLDLNLSNESLETTDLEDQILRRAFSCIDQLEPKRQLAHQYIQQVQEKWKSRHQISAQAQAFHLGDKVMVHRTSLQNCYDVKFEPKWKGPYIIH